MKIDQSEMIYNALAFLDRAAQDISAAHFDRSSMLFSIVHASMAIELLLKANLIEEHWTLVFKSSDFALSAKESDFDSSKTRTIGADESLKRLKGIVGIELSGKIESGVKSIFNKRNQIAHYQTQINIQEASTLVAQAMYMSKDVLLPPVLKHIDERSELLNQFLGGLRIAQGYLDTKYAEIREEIDDQHACYCTTCKKKSALLEGDMFKCMVCNSDRQISSFRELEGVPCDECGYESSILNFFIHYDGYLTGDRVEGPEKVCAFCLGCNSYQSFTVCPRCETIHEGEFVCEACQDHIDGQ